MATNLLQDDGSVIDVTLTGTVSSGDPAAFGNIVGIYQNDGVSGDVVAFKVTGVHSVTKTGSQAWTVGELIYLDTSPLEFTNVATANFRAGIATIAVAGGAGDTTGEVRLDGAGHATGL